MREHRCARRTGGGRRRVVASLAPAAVLALVLAGCGAGEDQAAVTSGFTETNPDGMHGAVLGEAYDVPEVSLTATDGTPFSLTEDTTRDVTLVFFGYTHCPDICQLVMADITSAVARLSDEQRDRVGVVFVTSDPARDDEATLRQYLDRFDPSFEGLTGDLATIVAAARDLGVEITKGRRMPSGGYEVTHGTQIIGVDEDDRAPIVWTEGTPAAQLAEDLEVLLTRGIPEPEASS